MVTYALYIIIIIIMIIFIYSLSSISFCEYDYAIDSTLDTGKLNTLIEFLNAHPGALSDALNTVWRWDIIDLFMYQKPEYFYKVNELWSSAWYSASETTKFQFYRIPLYTYTYVHILAFFGGLIKGLDHSIHHAQSRNKILDTGDIPVDIGAMKLLLLTVTGILNFSTSVFLGAVVDELLVYELTREIFINNIASYMLKEIYEGNISPELLDLLYKIFQL